MEHRIEVKPAQLLDRIGNARSDLRIALKTADDERKSARSHGSKDLGVGIARHMAAADETRDCDQSSADAADGIGQSISPDTTVARVEARMDVHDCPGLIGGPPK